MRRANCGSPRLFLAVQRLPGFGCVLTRLCSASEEEEDGGWQHVPRAAEGRLPGQYKSIYNNIAAEQWDEEEVQI